MIQNDVGKEKEKTLQHFYCHCPTIFGNYTRSSKDGHKEGAHLPTYAYLDYIQ